MNYCTLLFLAGAVLLSACGSHSPNTKPDKADSTARPDSAASQNSFFPVAEYLEAEILHVDSSLLALHKYTTSKGHTDSAFITVPEFNALAIEFVPRELADGSFEKNFTESSFQDKATGSITFTYSANYKNPGLQRVDVVTVPGLRSQQVKSVYLEKTRSAGDSLILQKLFWRSQQSMAIATIVRIKGKPDEEQQLRVVWDNSAEEE